MIGEVQSDAKFHGALTDRYESLVTVMEDVVGMDPIPPHEQDLPGQRNQPPGKQAILDESRVYVYEIRDLVFQFAKPSAEGTQDRIGNLYNVHRHHFEAGLSPNEDGSGGLRGFVENQLVGWNGDARYNFDWRFEDLMVALAIQHEVTLALHEAMKLHLGLLCAARAKVLAVLDNTIRTLKVQDQEADNEIGTYLEDVWTAVKQNVSKINVLELVQGAMKEGGGKGIAGPAKVLSDPLTGLASDLLGVTVTAIVEPDSDDPRPTLQSAIRSIREVRKQTQADSAKIAKNIGTMREYLFPGGPMYAYTIHEDGPALPAPG